MRVAEQSFPWDVEPSSGQPRLAMDFTYDELSVRFLNWGLKKGNLDFFFKGLHKLGLDTVEALEQGVVLPRRLLTNLASGALPLTPFAAAEGFPSSDGSVKYRFTLHSGEAIESVYMPVDDRTTICVSSQVGCAMGCTFCATGKMGLVRQLSAGEIVGQVNEIMKRHPFPKGQRGALKVVFMGMGEPLHNLSQVMRAFEILTHPMGQAIWDRDIAISTSGLVPKLDLLARLPRRPQLLVSIGATSDERRSAIMPVNRAYPLEELMACLSRYPLRKHERIMFSYVLIRDVNDTPADMERLVQLTSAAPSLVNLIPMNEHEASPEMREPEEAHIQWFAQQLLSRGVFATIRRSKGRDVAAACGQLVERNTRRASARQARLVV